MMDGRKEPYVGTQLAIATASIMNLNNKVLLEGKEVIIFIKNRVRVLTERKYAFKNSKLRIKRERSTPNSVTSRLCTSSKQMKLASIEIDKTRGRTTSAGWAALCISCSSTSAVFM